MREILFRGKRTDNGEWIEGYLNQHRGRVIFDCCCNAINANDYYINDWTEKLDTDLYGCVYKVIPETVGQYTGLTDKKGKKIFEGDIVERVSDGERAVISWLKYSACFGLSFDGWCCGFDNYDDNLPSDFEVIGNIHDKPELLEGGEGNG